jgi:predicted secreted protein
MDMKYVFTISAISALAVLAGAIILLGDSDGQSDDMEANFIDDSGVLNAEVGKDVTIALEANATTGYHWKVVSSDGLELVNDWYESPTTSPQICGAGGTQYFTFHCDKAGTYEVVLDYLREWQGSEGNIKTVQITVA